jgi:hypothetical protein
MEAEVTDESELSVSICLGRSTFVDNKGVILPDAGVSVAGEVWLLAKLDPDNSPSSPHARCIAGSYSLIGLRLHLGSAQLYNGTIALDRYLSKNQFDRLITLVRPRFPGVALPIPDGRNW